MENEKKDNPLESLIDRAGDYIETRADLIKLKASKKISQVTALIISKIILGSLLVMFLMLINIALGLWLGEILQKTYLGFFTLAGIYLVLVILVYIFRDKLLKTPITDTIIDKLNN